MFRWFIFAIGISMCIVGAECLVIDQAVVNMPNKEAQQVSSPFAAPQPVTAQREVKPPEWAPWSFLSVGFVVALYSLTARRD